MKVEINKKTIEIPDKEIKQFMKSLDITEKEAVQMWLDDHDYTTNAEVEELTKKAKANKTDKIVVQSKVEKAKTERKPKENPLKQAIIQDIYNYLSKNATLYNVKIENPTKIITFFAENREFKLDLVENQAFLRKDKKIKKIFEKVLTIFNKNVIIITELRKGEIKK